jgi:hypothetical protein
LVIRLYYTTIHLHLTEGGAFLWRRVKEKKEEEAMEKRELLMKTKIEFRAFEFLLDRYNDPVLAYEA